MKTLLRILQLPAVIWGLHFLTVTAAAQTTAFTYQGRLTDNAAAANGNYDIRFALHSAATGNTGVGSPVVVNPVTVTNGLFTATLDFGANFPGADRWLQIEVRASGSAAGYTPLTPRQKLTSAPYATRAASAATSAALSGNITAAQVSGGTLNINLLADSSITAAKLASGSVGSLQLASGSVDTGEIAALAVTSDKLANNIGLWNKSGATINYTAGAVGIGTTAPQGKLDISTGAGNVTIRNESNLVPGLNVSGTGAYAGHMRFRNVLEVWPNDANTASGRVAVLGTTGSTSINLDGDTGDVSGNSLTANTAVGQVAIRNDGAVPGINVSGGGLPGIMRFRNSLEVWPNAAGTSAGRIDVRNTAGSPTIVLDGQSGDTTVKTMSITGGADIAEPFQMSGEEIPKGSVVVIDGENAGKLKLSDRAYDSRVAGIVSGANGVNPGLALHQAGVIEGGQNVALTGRVHAMADATGAPIKPGDLLTTSSTPGHAMKVTDRDRGHGAILGKAMSSLEAGQGWVLVLVNLQ